MPKSVSENRPCVKYRIQLKVLCLPHFRENGGGVGVSSQIGTLGFAVYIFPRSQINSKMMAKSPGPTSTRAALHGITSHVSLFKSHTK
jgi:hypothetical protein